jgi:N-acetylmuramoyl-L-alanine amidase
MKKVVISSGHGLHVRGAAGYIDEVDEARRVVDRTAEMLRSYGVEVVVFHDDESKTQSDNLEAIVVVHNGQGPHDLDVSVHFNAYETTSKPMGCEVLFVSTLGEAVASDVVSMICHAAPFINRGAKERDDLAFLNGTDATSVLIEVCFVDSRADVDIYHAHFEDICTAIAAAIVGEETESAPPPIYGASATFRTEGRCSCFGGPGDAGVDPDEGLAFFYDYEDAPHLFLPQQPSGTTGLARRLNPGLFYVACRWDYANTPKAMLADPSTQALVRAGNKEFLAWPADWGPHGDTERAVDISPGLMAALGLITDDVVEVIYPYAPSLAS